MVMMSLDPREIERKSFEIIEERLKGRVFDPDQWPVIRRCIHTSADFDYADTLYFSDNAVSALQKALRGGCPIVTDTQMARAGLNKTLLARFNIEAACHIADEDVAAEAGRRGLTRAIAAMEKALRRAGPVLFVVGNAPTALIRLHQAIAEEDCRPAGVIAVPVGFVNVTESKEMIMRTPGPMIVARGQKGGSNIAAAVINALLGEIS